MNNQIEKLSLKLGYLLVEPQPDSTSGFSSEHKKYDRKSLGTIVKGNPTDDYRVLYKPGTMVLFDDANSINFQANGTSYEVVNEKDILGLFEED